MLAADFAGVCRAALRRGSRTVHFFPQHDGQMTRDREILQRKKHDYCRHRRHRRHYGVASVSKIDKIIGLFCKRDLKKRLYSAKETCNFIDPTNRSHPIPPPDISCASENAIPGFLWVLFLLDSD